VVPDTLDALDWLRKHLDADGTDVVREMVRSFADWLMSAEADALCGAGYGERSPERVNSRNGYRPRELDTRAGTIEVAVPKLRSGSYFPGWLLEPRESPRVLCSAYPLVFGPGKGDCVSWSVRRSIQQHRSRSSRRPDG
jgi:Transposase, Mutator family